MAIFLIIISIIAWCASLVLLFKNRLVAPVVSYIGLLLLSLAKMEGMQLVPINGTILVSWLCMTLIVMAATVLQSADERNDNRGIGYLLGGALTGMMVGLLAFTMQATISMLFGIMVIATACGVFFGYLLFASTPSGKPFSLAGGKFYTSLLAKGFPVAITVMQIGVALVIILAKNLS